MTFSLSTEQKFVKENSESAMEKNTSIIIDSEKYLVIQDGKAMEFPRKEFELLKLLCSSPGKVFSRSFIFEAVWGKSKSNERTVDVHILNIRKKLGEGLVRTIKGVGYKITTEDVKLKDIKTN